MHYNYPAIFELDENGVYLVSFPDIEGCYTDGATLKEALDNAEDVLNLLLLDMEEAKAEIPVATHPAKIKLRGNAFIQIIKANTPKKQII